MAIAAAIIGAGALGAGASIYGADQQSGAAGQAAGLAGAAGRQAQGQLQPYYQAGTVALDQLAIGAGLPGYGQGGTEPLTQQQVSQIYQRYMGRPVGAQEMAQIMASNQTAAQLEQVVAQSPESLQHQNVQHNVGPMGQPMFSGQASGQTPGGMQTGSLTKPFTLADFTASPAYNFNLEQGQQAIDKSANARGNYYAPQTLQDLSKFSQGLASNEFQNAYSNYNTNQANIWNRLYGLSGGGQNAAVQQGGFGTNAAAQVGGYGTSGAAAGAAGVMGAANSLASIPAGIANYNLANTYNQYLQSQILGGAQKSNYVNPYPSAG